MNESSKHKNLNKLFEELHLQHLVHLAKVELHAFICEDDQKRVIHIIENIKILSTANKISI